MIKIHKQLWYTCKKNPSSGDEGLAYMTHYEENAAFEKRKSTGTGWSRTTDGVTIDNSPAKGFYIGSSVSRWSTSNKLFRVKDPRGFVVEVPTDNIATLLHLCAVDKGVVQEECVWGREGNNHILLPVNSEPYTTSLEQMDTLSNKLIPIKELKIGDVVKLFGQKGEYTYHGKLKITWKLTQTERNSYYFGAETSRAPIIEEFEDDKWVNIFSSKSNDYRSDSTTKGNQVNRYKEMNNPKIVEIVKNVGGEIPEGDKLYGIWSPSRIDNKAESCYKGWGYNWHINAEVVSFKVKEGNK